eukprot:RCo050620
MSSCGVLAVVALPAAMGLAAAALAAALHSAGLTSAHCNRFVQQPCAKDLTRPNGCPDPSFCQRISAAQFRSQGEEYTELELSRLRRTSAFRTWLWRSDCRRTVACLAGIQLGLAQLWFSPHEGLNRALVTLE